MTLNDYRKQAVNLLRSSVIGTWVGILPGIGANIGSVMAYSAAKNASNEPEAFGKGSEDGVVASEAANNATVGGALIPLVAMGIPGSVIDAILLGALADAKPNKATIAKMQDHWVNYRGYVKKKAPIDQLADTSIVEEAAVRLKKEKPFG